jgi:hypothetical protein
MCEKCDTHCAECGEPILFDQTVCFGPGCKHKIWDEIIMHV